MEGSGVASFRGDDAYGMSLVVRHLIENGHRSVALVGGTDQTSTGRDRAQGYRDALVEAGIAVRPEWWIKGPRSRHQGFDAAADS